MLNQRTDRLILKIPCKETHLKIARLVIAGLATELNFSISEIAYLRSKLSTEILNMIKNIRRNHAQADWLTLSIIASKKSIYFEVSDESGTFRGTKHYRHDHELSFLDAFSESIEAKSTARFDIMTYLE